MLYITLHCKSSRPGTIIVSLPRDWHLRINESVVNGMSAYLCMARRIGTGGKIVRIRVDGKVMQTES